MTWCHETLHGGGDRYPLHEMVGSSKYLELEGPMMAKSKDLVS